MVGKWLFVSHKKSWIFKENNISNISTEKNPLLNVTEMIYVNCGSVARCTPFLFFFSLWAGLYFPQCLILERKMAQEAHEGLYGQRRILRNVTCTCIAKKWKSISTRGICSAALLRNASDTYPEILLANSSFQVLILSLSVFQTIIHIMCGKASPFRKKKKKKVF